MGNANFLDQAKTDQVLRRKGNEYYCVGVASMQGFRTQDEDRHALHFSCGPKHPQVAVFGIFDGHSGSGVSSFLESRLTNEISNMTDPTDEKELVEVFHDLDAELGSNPDIRLNGSTCTICIVQPSEDGDHFDIIAANVGDSRSILIHQNGTMSPLTTDHKPDCLLESNRIVAADGFVHGSRVDGQLAVSRAFGDFHYKGNANIPADKQKVIATPDIVKVQANKSDVLLLCCDGLIEKAPISSIESTFRKLSEEESDLAKICSKLNMYSLNKGSLDNHTVMAISFKDGTVYHCDNDERVDLATSTDEKKKPVNALEDSKTPEPLPAFFDYIASPVKKKSPAKKRRERKRQAKGKFKKQAVP